jgi:hypothetical protein
MMPWRVTSPLYQRQHFVPDAEDTAASLPSFTMTAEVPLNANATCYPSGDNACYPSADTSIVATNPSRISMGSHSQMLKLEQRPPRLVWATS